MSDTPRTDHEIEVNQFDRFEADWPRKLERESDQLAKQCVKLVEEIGQLRTRNKHLDAVIKSWKEDEGADARRLVFLLSKTHYAITREEIDERMKGEQS
jgi:hypothetical protein